MNIDEAQVVLTLEIEVPESGRQKLLDFCARAFPVYESLGGSRMALFEKKGSRGSFVEVGYYETVEDYKKAEKAVRLDPVQSQLIKEWRALLKTAPKVSVYNRLPLTSSTSSIRRRT